MPNRRKSIESSEIDINMGEYPTPKLSSSIDVVPAMLPIPGFLIAATVLCVFLLLFTLGYATKAQFEYIEVTIVQSILLACFGFMFPAFNIHLVSRGDPLTRWALSLNLVGVLVIYFLGLRASSRFEDLNFSVSCVLVLLVLGSIYILSFRKKTRDYYHALKTGELRDQSLIDPFIKLSTIQFLSKKALVVVEILIVILALWVAAYALWKWGGGAL